MKWLQDGTSWREHRLWLFVARCTFCFCGLLLCCASRALHAYFCALRRTAHEQESGSFRKAFGTFGISRVDNCGECPLSPEPIASKHRGGGGNWAALFGPHHNVVSAYSKGVSSKGHSGVGKYWSNGGNRREIVLTTPPPGKLSRDNSASTRGEDNFPTGQLGEYKGWRTTSPGWRTTSPGGLLSF